MPALQHLLDQFELHEHVHFLGWQSADEVKRAYAAANLFLHPSRHEGMPNAILEAMSTGLPVIATRIAGNEELVLEGSTGLLFPVEDADALRRALSQLLPQAKRREQMGTAGRRRVEESFGWGQVAEQYRTILERAIG